MNTNKNQANSPHSEKCTLKVSDTMAGGLSYATREENGVLCVPSRQGLTHQVGLGCNPEIPISPGEEH